MKKVIKRKSNRHIGKAKPSKYLTREDILNLPDAPIGQRACDVPVSKEIVDNFMRPIRSFVDDVLRTKRLKDDAAQELTGDKTEIPDYWERALEVCKATGMQPDRYNHLTVEDEIKVLRTAAKMKRREQVIHKITLAVAEKYFCVSIPTLKRKIKEKKLTSYRDVNAPKNGEHLVDAKEVAALYPKRS